MPTKSCLIIVSLLGIACNNNSTLGQKNRTENVNDTKKQNNPYKKINEIPLPEGYTRATFDENSYGDFLQQLRLKKDKTVYTYSGAIKQNQAAQFAVLDITVGNKDLQQCADAVMRLRAEYLYQNKRYNEIDFIDNNVKHYKFTAPYTKEHFTTYLQQVFGMCGSASLSKQLKPITTFKNITSGDVIIKGGFPGHAVQVIDVAVNDKGEKIYLLAQSYMPAQDIHVLVNNNNMDLSPWYSVNDEEIIYTPEYTFKQSDLKSW
jgi:hypothetical protein